jgi:ATP phosphoribosyltransferase regulatory subunit
MARWRLPEGISDVLPQEAGRIEELRRALLDLYRSHGYALVIPPLVEHLDSLLTGTGRDLDLRTFALVDQLSGRQLGLRADITPQTARIDAHILNRSGVARLCYAGSVLHTRPAHPLASRQPIQVGAEVYGAAGVAADAEVQRLAVQSLRCAGVKNVCFDLGHTGVVRALLASDAAAQVAGEEIQAALTSKDRSALAVATASVSAASRAALTALLDLGGDLHVLKEARRVLPPLPSIAKALDDLAWLADQLDADRIGIDLADLHGYRYYTGANFAAYAANAPAALLRGGRYDDIGRAFGRTRPATGFSIVDLRELSRQQANGVPRAILAPLPGDPQAEQLAAALRAQGEIVISALGENDAIEGFDIDRELRLIDGHWQVAARGAQ